jgi:beta-N-acetylhexosaminidase
VELGYSGVVITDDLRMKSLSSHMPVEEAALKSVLAGADIALVCRETDIQMRTMELFYRAADGGALSDARINDACGRIRALKGRYLPAFSRPELAVIGCEEHRWLAGKIGNQRPPASR